MVPTLRKRSIARWRRRLSASCRAARGYGLDGDGGFAYLDTIDDVGMIVELIEFPARRREPEGTWQPSAGEAA